jgi:hypothetical protein
MRYAQQAMSPAYVILDLPFELQNVKERLYLTYEDYDRVDLRDGIVEEELSGMLDKLIQCLGQRDIATECLNDYVEEMCSHDIEFDMGQYKIADAVRLLGQSLLRQFHQHEMYWGGEFLPYFYKERLGHDALILQRVDYSQI